MRKKVRRVVRAGLAPAIKPVLAYQHQQRRDGVTHLAAMIRASIEFNNVYQVASLLEACALSVEITRPMRIAVPIWLIHNI